MKKIDRISILIVSMIIILILIDQLSKLYITINLENTIINGILRLKITENTGGAFGVGQNSTFTYIVTNIVVLGIIIKFMTNGNQLMDKKTKVFLSLILAGGISNLIDRIFRGYVVDFIDITGFINFPVINLADIYITIGWIGIVILFAMFAINEKRNKNQINKE